MDYDFVDRCAQCVRESPVAFEPRYSTIVADELFGDLVELEGSYTRGDTLGNFAKCTSHEHVGCAHALYLFFSLKKNHFNY